MPRLCGGCKWKVPSRFGASIIQLLTLRGTSKRARREYASCLPHAKLFHAMTIYGRFRRSKRMSAQPKSTMRWPETRNPEHKENVRP